MTYVDPAMRREHRIVSRHNIKQAAGARALAELMWTDLATIARKVIEAEVQAAIDRGELTEEQILIHENDIRREEELKKKRKKDPCNLIPLPLPSKR